MVYQREAAADPSEFVRGWALGDGTRCVLAVVGPFLELRIMSDDLIVRHARFTEMQRALDAAQLWRVECEVGLGHVSGAPLVCPECAEYALAADGREDGCQWWCCPHCGYLWTAGAANREPQLTRGRAVTVVKHA
jgi:hypothetical protein